MFTEVLRIKPVLDETTARAMETSLASRFSRVAQRFGSGLKSVIKGTFLGVSLGLINRLLNPIGELDQKIKGLLGKSSDLTELADRFGTTPAKLEQLQKVAEKFNIGPDKFRDILEKYAEAVEKAREELGNKFEQKSASTVILGQLSKQKDIAESFEGFLKVLRSQKEGTLQPLTTGAARTLAETQGGKTLTQEQRDALIKSGEIRFRNAEESVAILEKEVLGAQQFGGFKKLINADIGTEAKTLGLGNTEDINAKVKKVTDLDTKNRILQIQNDTKDFIKGASLINETIVKDLENRRQQEQAEMTDRIASYDNIAKTADFLDEISRMMFDMTNTIIGGIRMLGDLAGDIKEIRKSGIWRTFFRGGK